MGASSAPARMLECSDGHHWHSSAADTSIVRCPVCSTATRVGPAVRRAAAVPVGAGAVKPLDGYGRGRGGWPEFTRQARPVPAAPAQREKTPPPASRLPMFEAAPRPAPARRLPGLTAAERAAALSALSGVDEGDPAELDDDDEDDPVALAELDDRISNTAALLDMARTIWPSSRPGKAPAPAAPPEVTPDDSGALSGRLAGRMTGPAAGHARPAPAPAATKPGRRSAARVLKHIGFPLNNPGRMVRGNCPILTNGRECPSLADSAFCWPNIDELSEPFKACLNHCHEIAQRAINEGLGQPEIKRVN